MNLLIKRARIITGGTVSPDLKDIFVNDERISAIGDFPNKNAQMLLDAQGAYLSPGFIDVNTDSDHYLTVLFNPSQEDFIRQGVTTILGGMCGASLAPLLYGSLESVQKWGDVSNMNVDWHSMGEFLRILDRHPLSVNFGTLTGHSTIRRALIGENLRDLSRNELEIFSKTLRAALQEGAFGLSTGLGYVHSFHTPYSELKFLAEIAKEFKGVYATHLRKGGVELGESVDETIKLAEEVGLRTIISHFVPTIGNEKTYEEALQKLDTLPESTQLRFDVYPSNTSVLALYTFLPRWVQTGGREVMLANVKDEWLRARILKDLPKIEPDDFIIAQAPGNDFLVGKSLRDLTVLYDMAPEQALLKLMVTTQLKATIFHRNVNTELVKKALRSRRSLVSTNSASFSNFGKVLKPERATSTFTRFLEIVENEKLIPFEEAMRKITREPAEMFDIPQRGEIKEGNFADLVIFSLTEGADGKKKMEVKSVVVNGEVALNNGRFENKLKGKNLRHLAT